MSQRARTVLLVLAWSVVVWVALWSSLTPANALLGALVGAATIMVAPAVLHVPHHRIRPVPLLRLLGHFLAALVEASVIVAWEVVTPRNRINEAIVRVPLRTGSRGLTTAVANAVSLTPGTLTIEVHEDPMVLYVHVLHLDTIESARQQVQDLEDRFLAAFPEVPAADTDGGDDTGRGRGVGRWS